MKEARHPTGARSGGGRKHTRFCARKGAAERREGGEVCEGGGGRGERNELCATRRGREQRTAEADRLGRMETLRVEARRCEQKGVNAINQ